MHRDSYVHIDSISYDQMDSAAFASYDEFNNGTDGEFIMYFPGDMTYFEAITQFDFLKENKIVSD